jgi:L-histidine N-alpha-methyltransferase
MKRSGMEVAADQANAARFADDVQYYLAQTPRQLPSRYLYDALGTKLFEAICRMPWYRVTRAEDRLLAAHGSRLFARPEGISTLVELGPGSGDKLATIIAAMPRRRPVQDVHLVDVSATALEDASRTVQAVGGTRVVPHQATYESGLLSAAAERRPDGRLVVVFLGSNIGNFDPEAAGVMLARIRGALRSGDALLLGADLVKPVHDLLVAYDDPLGVTAAFNRNLLVRMNGELGADFDLGTFDHRSRWNVDARSIEMHLVSRRAQRVTIPGAGLKIEFAAGESIWTESSFKYDPARLDAMARAAGFALDAQWIDPDARYALSRFIVA